MVPIVIIPKKKSFVKPQISEKIKLKAAEVISKVFNSAG
jgi:hypothetical protein